MSKPRPNKPYLCPTWEREISSQCSVRAETTWRRTRRNGQVGRDEEGSAWTEWATSSQDKDNVIDVKYVHCWGELQFCLFQENKSYGIKTICIDPLSTHCCTSRREQYHSWVNLICGDKPFKGYSSLQQNTDIIVIFTCTSDKRVKQR